LLDIPETDDHFEFKTGVPLHAVLDGEDDRVNLAMVNEFHYRAARSLLGAKITPIVDENFGYSVDMDRETISGGYTKVSWPSFVGWA